MKSVCFLCFCAGDKGGVNRVVASLCRELSLCKDYRIHILSVCGSENICAYEVGKGVSIECLRANTSWRLRKIATFSFRKIIKYLNTNKIDVTFMVGHYIPAVALMTRPFVKSKFIFCDHGALENQLNDRKATLFRRMACKFSNKVIVLTERSVEAYKRYFKIADKNIDYIYNFLDDRLFEYAGEYNANSCKILSVGRTTPEKGYEMLIDVAKVLLSKYTNWEWHIYGDGDNINELKSKVQDIGLENRLIFKGGGHDIYSIYKEYSIYVMTSYREGLPLVLLEAKANSLPVVSFNCLTGPAEIVRDEIDGFLIECYNKEMMVKRISKLIDNSRLRKDMSIRSKENLYKFKKEEIMDKWKVLIDTI